MGSIYLLSGWKHGMHYPQVCTMPVKVPAIKGNKYKSI